MHLNFTKMQGCGNDYIYLDCRISDVPHNISALATELSARHLSIGADGIICICPAQSAHADATMRIFNADGSEGKMCGNGIRCVAQWLRTHVLSCSEKDLLFIDSLSGTKAVAYKGNAQWQVAMGQYHTIPETIPVCNMGTQPIIDQPLCIDETVWHVSCISVGNPHCVTIVKDVNVLKLTDIGPTFETHANFPERINTEFIEVVDATHLKMRVWERGSGETYACGTGACASVAAMVEQGICPRGQAIEVALRGGTLHIEINTENEILMTGPAKIVYEGIVNLAQEDA